MILNVTSYNVTEGGENLTVCAEIQNPDPDTVMCPVDVEFSVTFNSVTDTAGVKQIHLKIKCVSIVSLCTVAGFDYEALSKMSPIEKCGRSTCVDATIVDDTALEGTEQFFITLDRGLGMSGRIRIVDAYKRATITIFEDNLDGMCGIQWNLSNETERVPG